jgi:hypothetical protein
MHDHTTIPFLHQQLFTEEPFTEVVRQGTGSGSKEKLPSPKPGSRAGGW